MTTVIGEKSILCILNADDTRVIAETAARLEARRKRRMMQVEQSNNRWADNILEARIY